MFGSGRDWNESSFAVAVCQFWGWTRWQHLPTGAGDGGWVLAKRCLVLAALGKIPLQNPVYANLQIPTCHPAPATAQPEAKTTTTNKVLSTGSITGTWGDTKALLGDILAVAETFPTGMSCFSMVQCQTNGADPPECFISLCSCAFHHSRAED